MIKSMEDLKEFITWAKEQGLKEAKIGEHHFSFSEYELAKRIMDSTPALSNEPESQSTNVRAQNLKEQADINSEEEDLKFWSSRP